jgi:hypothetical protein
VVRIGSEIAFFAVAGELLVEVGIQIKQAMGLPGSMGPEAKTDTEDAMTQGEQECRS